MRDGEFSYPEHPEEYLPSWVFEMEDCSKCSRVLPDSAPAFAHVEDHDYEYAWIEYCNCEEEE